MLEREVIKGLESLHNKILSNSFAEKVSENEMLALCEAKKLIKSWHRTAELNAARIIELESYNTSNEI